MKWIEQIPWVIIIVLCLTIGLAPFRPPHIVEKLEMLVRGDLRRTIDWADLLMHGTPWLLALAKMVYLIK